MNRFARAYGTCSGLMLCGLESVAQGVGGCIVAEPYTGYGGTHLDSPAAENGSDSGVARLFGFRVGQSLSS